MLKGINIPSFTIDDPGKEKNKLALVKYMSMAAFLYES